MNNNKIFRDDSFNDLILRHMRNKKKKLFIHKDKVKSKAKH